MNICYLSLGSNQKCPARQIRLAIKALKNIPRTIVLKTSKLYWTKAWGLEAQQDFCNIIVQIATMVQPTQLLFACKRIEQNQGRIRKRHWGPRVLDIDIILYAKRKINTNHLKIPHPHFMEREFVILPLQEVSKDNIYYTIT
jgi:2-amino-4-hydroxy-6-hydroxymethyldihydropteridine diphosphokinase